MAFADWMTVGGHRGQPVRDGAHQQGQRVEGQRDDHIQRIEDRGADDAGEQHENGDRRDGVEQAAERHHRGVRPAIPVRDGTERDGQDQSDQGGDSGELQMFEEQPHDPIGIAPQPVPVHGATGSVAFGSAPAGRLDRLRPHSRRTPHPPADPRRPPPLRPRTGRRAWRRGPNAATPLGPPACRRAGRRIGRADVRPGLRSRPANPGVPATRRPAAPSAPRPGGGLGRDRCRRAPPRAPPMPR